MEVPCVPPEFLVAEPRRCNAAGFAGFRPRPLVAHALLDAAAPREALLLIEETLQDLASVRSSCPAAHAGIRWSWRCCRARGSLAPREDSRRGRSRASRGHAAASEAKQNH